MIGSRGWLGMVAVVFAFVGCGKPRPAESDVRAEIARGLAPHVQLAEAEMRFSPLREIMGTTLPQGTWQIQVECRMKAKEALYTVVDSTGRAKDKRLPAAMRDQLAEVERALTEGLDENTHFLVTRAGRGVALRPAFLELFPANAAESASVLIAATPRPNGWTLDILETTVGECFQGARPKDSLDSAAQAFSSTEYQEYLSSLVMKREAERKRARARAAIQPEIDALRRSSRELTQRYDEEAQAVLKNIAAEMMVLNTRHEERARKLIRDHSAATDGYAARDRLLKQESEQFEAERARLYAQYGEAERAASTAGARANAEIEARVQQLLARVDASHPSP